MTVRYGSMYERLIKSLEEAVNMVEGLKHSLESINESDVDIKEYGDLDKCKQTIRAGKAFVEVQNLDYRDYLEVKRLLKERKDAKDA